MSTRTQSGAASARRKIVVAASLAATLSTGVVPAEVAIAGSAQAATSQSVVLKDPLAPNDRCKVTATAPHRVSSSSPTGGGTIVCTVATNPNLALTVSRLRLTVKLYFKGTLVTTKAVASNPKITVSRLTDQVTVGCNNGTYHTIVDATIVWGYQTIGGIKVPQSNGESLWSPIVRTSTCGAV